MLGTKNAHKENPRKEFQRESGREVSGPEFFMLVSFFPSKIQCIKNFKGGGSQGLGGGLRPNFGGHFYVLFRDLILNLHCRVNVDKHTARLQ